MIVFSLLSLSGMVLCIFLAAVVYQRSPLNQINRIFSLLCISFAAWSFMEFMTRQAETADRARLWLDLSFVWPISVALLFHFVVAYTDSIRTFSKLWHVLVYGPAVAFSVLDWLRPTSIATREYWGWTYRIPHGSLWYHVGNTWAAVMGVLSLGIVVWYVFKAPSSRARRQSKYVATGLAVAVFAGGISEWLYPLFSIRIPELTNSAFAVMTALMAYAIWRYDLFTLSPAVAADTIVETMSDALVVVNTERRIEIVNPALIQMLGYSERDLIGRGMELIIGHVRNSEESVTELLRTGTVTDVETSFRKKNGDLIPVSLSWSVLRDANRKLRGIVFVSRDITERERAKAELQRAHDLLEKRVKERTAELQRNNEQLSHQIAERQQAEERLAAEKERLAVTLRSIADGVITADNQGRVVLLNKAAEELTGWNHSDAEGKNLDEVYVTKDDAGITGRHDYCRVFSGPQSASAHQVLLVSRTGDEYTVAESGAPIFDRSGKIIGTVLVFQNVTDKMKLEEELFKARKLESMSLLASGLAHDFNNILTGIITNLFMAKMGVTPESESHELITAAEKAAFRASTLTNQLLTFARTGTPIKQYASIRALIEDSVGFYLSGSKADYRLELDDDLWNVEIDRGQIDQVLNNMIINADQSMPDGGTITVRAGNTEVGRLTTLPLEPGRYVKLSIIDSGVGIAPENLNRVFDPYFTTRENGTGLGLTTSYAIVQKHGGHIQVSSQQGAGTTFTIYLPAVASGVVADTEGQMTEALSGRGRILLMDDEEFIRKSAAAVLTHLGYEVELAENGDAAVRLYGEALEQGQRFDAVLMDLTIPGGKGGKESVGKVLEIDESAVVIVTSGYSNDPVMTEYDKYGFKAAIRKPFNIEDLSALLRELMYQDKSDAQSTQNSV